MGTMTKKRIARIGDYVRIEKGSSVFVQSFPSMRFSEKADLPMLVTMEDDAFGIVVNSYSQEDEKTGDAKKMFTVSLSDNDFGRSKALKEKTGIDEIVVFAPSKVLVVENG